MKQFVPAILTHDISVLKEQVHILQGMVDLVQLDVMDGSFVDKTTVEVDEFLQIPFSFQVELHLMVDYPTDYAIFCKDKRIVRSIFHFQSQEHPAKVIDHFKKYDVQVGIAINPEVAVQEIAHVIPDLDYILLMSVNPGAQGQPFIPEVLAKVEQIREMKREIFIGIDGGVKGENLAHILSYDINYICVGSGIWTSEHTREEIKKFQAMIEI